MYFYRANADTNAAGRPLPFHHVPILERIADLPFTEAGRYLLVADGNAVCCWPEPKANRLRLGGIRRTGLPQLDQQGRLRALPIPANAGLAEQIHVVFYPHNIVGSESTFMVRVSTA